MCDVCFVKCGRSSARHLTRIDLIEEAKPKPTVEIKIVQSDDQIDFELAYEWHIAVENRQSGLRQRAQQRGFKRWATRKELKALLVRQKLLCPYTGRPLQIASLRLAHKIPASRGGSFEASNLVWTSSEVNREMGTMTEGEYLLSKV